MYNLTPHDYNIRHRGTYVAYQREDGKLLPVLITNCTDDMTFMCNLFENGEEKQIELDVGDESLILDYPELGAINTETGLVLWVERRRQKQWRTTLQADSICTIDPYLLERKILGVPQLDRGIHNYSFLESLFNNTHYGFDKALWLVKNNLRVAASIDREWHLGIKAAPNRICIHKGRHIVSHINRAGQIILTQDMMFMQEQLAEFGREVLIV
jgi:hypothetical protein